jgi:CRISPR/Cas system-associated exonuclease Cas4 (RecB family)
VVEFLRTWNRFSATQLDAYLACPLRFYHSAALGLKEKAEASEDVDQRDVGSLVHRILKEFFSSFTGQPLNPESIKPTDLDAAIDRCFIEEYGKDLLGPALFLRQQVRLQLRKFLERYQVPIAQSNHIVITGLEQKFTVESRGIRFTGSIDRVETRGGKPFILDYKTGKDDAYVKIQLAKIDPKDPDSWREAIGSFQLPLYMLLYSEASQQPIDVVTPTYVFLGKNDISMEIESGIGDNAHSAAEVYQAVEPVMFSMIEEILNLDVPFKPTDHLEEECPRCPYSAICGTRWAEGWRRE